MKNVFIVAVFIVSLTWHNAESQSCSLDSKGEVVDVLILGAGIAGITAARTLQVNGIDNFLVLEATSQVGGRIRADPDTGVELGASWIHGIDPHAKSLHPLWREWMNCNDGYGPNGSPTPDITSVYDADGKEINIDMYNTELDNLSTALEKIEQEVSTLPDDVSMRKKLNDKGWMPKTQLQNFTEWYSVDFCVATTPGNLSAKLFHTSAYSDFLGTPNTDDVGDYLVTDVKGYNFIVECMADQFMDNIALNSPVTKIETPENCVCATVKDGTRYCGYYSMLTFSIGVLQGAIKNNSLHPPLPSAKVNAITNVSVVHYARIYLTFNETFWNETDDYQQIIGHASGNRGEYPVFMFDRNRPTVITVDVTEDLALEVENQTNCTSTTENIMKILRIIYINKYIPDPVDCVISNWSIDPYFRGSWTAFGVGTPTDIIDQLLTPVNRLYFAGESLNRSHYGYTHGAYGSGAHVANNIISKMKCKLLAVIYTPYLTIYLFHSFSRCCNS